MHLFSKIGFSTVPAFGWTKHDKTAPNTCYKIEYFMVRTHTQRTRFTRAHFEWIEFVRFVSFIFSSFAICSSNGKEKCGFLPRYLVLLLFSFAFSICHTDRREKKYFPSPLYSSRTINHIINHRSLLII